MLDSFMALSGLSFAAAEFAGFENAEEKERRTRERKRDADERAGDRAERQKIKQEARAECRHRGARRFAPGEVIGTLKHCVEFRRWGGGMILFHCREWIGASRATARIGGEKNVFW